MANIPSLKWNNRLYSTEKNVNILSVVLAGALILFCISFASAAEVPTVGGDSGTWGTILNEFLNVSLNSTGHLRANNVSFGNRITFALGAMLENLVTGWITVTGSLDVTNDTLIGGDLNVTGDTVITGDLNVVGDATLNGVSINKLTFDPIVGYTSSTYDGNITNGTLYGYVAANAICAAEYSSSHFCLKSEILKSIANEDYSFNNTAWFQNGPPGYTANADDCSGWTTDSNTYLGPFWNWDANDQAGRGALTNCAQAKQLMCCGGSS